MIFGENTTMLGASTIPMAEGYDGSEGIAVALVEAARNDRTMFNFMIRSDIRETNICRESAGVVMEGEVAALHEAVGGGIFRKIAELFRKLIAKIKSIFHTFMSKINRLYMDDATLIKKYANEIKSKDNINNLKVKWRKLKSGKDSNLSFAAITKDFSEDSDENYKEDEWDRIKFYLAEDVSSIAEYKKEYIKETFEDPKELKLSEIGGITTVIDHFKNSRKLLTTLKNNINKTTTRLESIVRDMDNKVKKAKTARGNSTDEDTLKEKNADVEKAVKLYDMAKAYQTATLATMDATLTCFKINYKQHKATFMKAIAANGKKLEESAIYLDAVAEAAEEEVEAVIDGALKGEDVSDVSLASKDVKDTGITDDFGKITDGPDTYLSAEKDTVDGTIDTVYDSKNEAAGFAGLLY